VLKQENELWDKESNHSIGSWVPPMKGKGDYAESHTASIYGRETYYEPRTQSPAPSQFGMLPPPGYNSGRNTPQSFHHPLNDAASFNHYANSFHQPAPSRPVTNYLDMPIPQTSQDGFEMGGGAGNSLLPPDPEIERAVQNILRTADLNTVTKREVRRQVEEMFGMDLTSRKNVINAMIDRILLGQA
jgi:chitin synthase